jgi:predicted nucleic acid-binding protein
VIVYFDSSAFVPLLVEEPSTPAAYQLWQAADRLVSCRLLRVEAAAGLARAYQMRRIDKEVFRRARDVMPELLDQLVFTEVGRELVEDAADYAYSCELRGYDAVHCASAYTWKEFDVVVATGDRALLRACQQLGMNTVDTSAAA